ncbi:hypothetical protein [Candidiatus Paracoxiella cheracis]|uniref:hypothetical protein n=1 Tax=Candidiatus Paracoxiella cheracis TaxID=3405120 RepID=UPI003BF474C2
MSLEWIKDNLDPKLNEQAFEACPLKKELGLDEIQKKLSKDWEDQLCQRLVGLDVSGQEKIGTKDQAKRHLERHFDEKKYVHTAALIQQLQMAFWYATDSSSPLSLEVKERLLISINEGVQQCSEGLHNRLNFQLLILGEAENLKQLLTSVRTKMVRAAYASLSNNFGEVHTYNALSKLARDLGLGVPMANEEDPYRGYLNVRSASDHLAKIFKAEYRAFNLPNLIFDELEDIFKKLGYSGEKKDGYFYDTYAAIVERLKSIMPVLSKGIKKPFFYWANELCNEGAPLDTIVETIFIIENELCVIDINRKNIKKLILEQLIEEKFVNAESCRAFNSLRDCSKDDGNLFPISLIDDAQYYALVEVEQREITKKHSIALINRSLSDQGDFLIYVENFGLSGQLFLNYCEVLKNEPSALININSIEPKLKKIINDDEIWDSRYLVSWFWVAQNLLLGSADLLTTKQESLLDIFVQALFVKDKTNQSGWMALAQYYPGGFKEAFRLLQTEEQKNCLLFALCAQGQQGLTGWIVLAQCAPAVLKTMLEFVSTKEQKASVVDGLCIQGDQGWTGWMMLAERAPACLDTALKFVCTNKQRNDVVIALCAQDQQGLTGWIVLAQCAPAVLKTMLEFVSTKEQKASVVDALCIQGDQGWTGWMVLAERAPACLDTALKFVCTNKQRNDVVIALCAQDQQGLTGWIVLVQCAPAVLKTMLEFVSTKEQKASVVDALCIQGDQGWTGWMVLARCAPAVLKTMLKFVCTNKQKNDVVTALCAQDQQSVTGWIILARYATNCLKTALEFVSTDEQKASVVDALCIQGDQGWTGWMVLARCAPAVLKTMLEFVSTKEQKASVVAGLSQKTQNGWAGWIILARYATNCLKTALEFVGTEEEKQRIIALCKDGHQGSTGWMVLARYAPQSLNTLLRFVRTEQQKVDIVTALCEKGRQGWTGWIVLAQYASKTLNQTFGFVRTQTQKKCVADALYEQNGDGLTGWIALARYAPDDLKTALEFVSTKEQKERMVAALCQKGRQNWTGWMVLARYALDDLKTVLEYVCTEEQRYNMVAALCQKERQGLTGWQMIMRDSAAIEKIYQWPDVGKYIRLLLYATDTVTQDHLSKIQKNELLRQALDIISNYLYSSGTGVFSWLRHAGGKLASKQCITKLIDLNINKNDINTSICKIMSQWVSHSNNHNSSRSSFLNNSVLFGCNSNHREAGAESPEPVRKCSVRERWLCCLTKT